MNDLGTGVRTFESGANRDVAEGKPDYEGYIRPEVLVEFGAYMERHQHLADGSVRASDNWQQGFGAPGDWKGHCAVCMKSLLRHAIDLWLFHRGGEGRDSVEDALGGLLFNTMAFWYGLIREREAGYPRPDEEGAL
jgi:hypothetical protein